MAQTKDQKRLGAYKRLCEQEKRCTATGMWKGSIIVRDDMLSYIANQKAILFRKLAHLPEFQAMKEA